MSLRASGGYIGPRPTGPTSSVASGIWDLRTAEQQKRIGEWPAAPGDPYWSNVSLLLHMDGSNGSTTFADSSPATKTVTRFGNAAISTAQGKFGGASALLAAATDYLQVPASAAFAPGTGDFTVEGWFYQTQEPPQYGAALWAQTASALNYFILLAGANVVAPNPPPRQLAFISTLSGAGTPITHPTVYSLNTWNHFAVTRSSGVVRIFLNGVGTSGTSNTTNLTNTTYSPSLGRPSHSGGFNKFVGYLDDIRYTLGVARYVTNFTPPAAPFPDGP